MSYGCNSDIVPFVKHCFFEGDPEGSIEASMLFNFDCYTEGECDFQFDWTDDKLSTLSSVPVEISGWSYLGYEDIGKRSRLYAHLWALSADKLIKVWILNSSQYSHVGEFEMSIIADNKASIEEFVKDFKDLMTSDFPIKEEDVVQQWG